MTGVKVTRTLLVAYEIEGNPDIVDALTAEIVSLDILSFPEMDEPYEEADFQVTKTVARWEPGSKWEPKEAG